ncbi:uncharacterized protein MYCFIDRAFT_170813 [Pseudocercospora fijiensis CIRAD86]|uniref:Uncharacterized protein n=1 Tax=Pseudocercospora fijiensis (strain CIRAD86) TaxID=383855 RepID=N1QCU5_PSEFD|nr:uncharacterized protein MYCFIDRAFT_170813 [Pseudocercospora fijiensis CIRAD86]EME89358.1 hypothetical protein MYCFIDRAFT_170813 [Pseudocercospora fijiensis CIRAD86]
MEVEGVQRLLLLGDSAQLESLRQGAGAGAGASVASCDHCRSLSPCATASRNSARVSEMNTSTQSNKPDQTCRRVTKLYRRDSFAMPPAKKRRNGALKRVLHAEPPKPEPMQRRLPKAARRDPYAMDESPEKPMASRKRVVMPGAEISPLKKRKAGPKPDAAAQNPVDAEQVAPTKHSKVSVTPRAERESPRKATRRRGPKDHEPHPGRRLAQEQASEQFEGDDASSDGLSVGQHDPERGRKVADAESLRPSEQQTTPQRKRGRPPKAPSSAEGTNGVQLEEIIADIEPSSAKRRSPRLTMKEKLAKLGNHSNAPMPPIERIGTSEVVFPEEENQPFADNSTQVGDEDADGGIVEEKSTRAHAKGKLRSPAKFRRDPDEQLSSSDESQHANAEDKATNAHFLGQWPVLRKIFAAARRRNIRSKSGKKRSNDNVEMEEDVAEALHACCQVEYKLTRLRDTEHATEQIQDPSNELNDLMERINILCNKERGSQADLDDENLARCIYVHLIDKVVDLLRHMMSCYKTIDQDDSVLASTMSLAHTRTCTRVMNTILEMGRVAKKRKLPSANERLRKSIEKDILRPLGKVVKVFISYLSVITRQQQLEEAQAQERQEREQLRLERRRKREERRERDQYEDLRKKWGMLHTERRRAEGGCLTMAKQRHLQYKESEPEVDQNGNLFERVEVFRTRAPGPSPAAIAQIRAGKTFRPWSSEALLALVNGLKRWSDDEEMVFTRIIREHCTRGGLLVDRNVTEIVVAAADLKELLSRSQEQNDGHVQDWVRKIPLWTEPRSLLRPVGQENGEEEDADDTDEVEAEAEEDVEAAMHNCNAIPWGGIAVMPHPPSRISIANPMQIITYYRLVFCTHHNAEFVPRRQHSLSSVRASPNTLSSQPYPRLLRMRRLVDASLAASRSLPA